MNVAILGCGPSGLLAAHAAVRAGHMPTIFSRKVKSPHGGAQYLHAPIPGYSPDDPDMLVRFVKLGTARGYAAKVYGDPDKPVSWTHFEERQVPAWSMNDVYDSAWRDYQGLVHDRELFAADVEQIVAGFEVVVNTVPLEGLCARPADHTFNQVPIVLDNRRMIGAENVVVYNGQRSEDWYRTSSIGEEHWTEYPAGRAPHNPDWITGMHKGFKVVDTDCNCHPTVHRMGRFGKWCRGELAHHTFRDAEKLFSGDWANRVG